MMRIQSMRLLTLSILLGWLIGTTPAQSSAEAAATAASKASTLAAERYKTISAQYAERIKAVPREDAAARAPLLAQHAAELQEFVREFGATIEGNRARFELCQLAMQDQAHLDAAKAALASYEPALGEVGACLMAARTAGMLGFADIKAKLLQGALARPQSIGEQVEMAAMLRTGFKEPEWADKLLAAAEARATTDETKAELLLAKAAMVRSQDRKNKAAYAAALAEVLAQYPATQAGRLVADKIAAGKLAVGSDPIAVTAKDLQGKDVSLADYRGKVLLIDFWATWCVPCMKEMPNVISAYAQFHDQGFEVLGISLDRATDRARLESTIAERGMTWRQVCDGKHWQAEVAQHYDVSSIPFTVLIGRDGKVAGLDVRGEELAKAVQAALDAK